MTASAPYYRHDDPTGSALNNVATDPAPFDELANGPRVYTYKPSFGRSSTEQYPYASQGIAYPAAAHYANQPQPLPQMAYPIAPTSAQLYGYNYTGCPAPADTPMGYYHSQPNDYSQTNAFYPTGNPHAPPGYYWPSQVASATHYPAYPQAVHGGGPQTLLPDGTTLFVGKTKEQVMWENQQIAENTGANKPSQMVPYNSAPGQQYWCREINGDWTMRTVRDTMDLCQPGYWDKGRSGYPIFIRQSP